MSSVSPTEPFFANAVPGGGKHRYCVILRHGERSDDVSDSTIPEGDPPLSPGGVGKLSQRARELSEKLAEFGISPASVQLYSSPFLRCRQTADGIATGGFGSATAVFSNKGPAVIDNEICEVFGPPRIKTADPPSPWAGDSIGTKPEWGESMEDAYDRFASAFKKHLVNAPGSLCLVTHGDMLAAMFRVLYPKRVVYNTDYLAYIILRLPSLPSLQSAALHADEVRGMGGDDLLDSASEQQGLRVSVELAAANGIDWLDEGPEDAPVLPFRLSGGEVKPLLPLDRPSKRISPGRHIPVARVALSPSQHRVSVEQSVTAASPEGPPTMTAIPIPMGTTNDPHNQPQQHEKKNHPHAIVAWEQQHGVGRGSPLTTSGANYGELSSASETTPSRNIPTKTRYWCALARCAGVGVQFALFRIPSVSIWDVSTLVGSLAVVELVFAFTKLYDYSPDRPLRAPLLSQTKDFERSSDDDVLLAPRRGVALEDALKFPLVAGIVKYGLALVLYLALAAIIRVISEKPASEALDFPKTMLTSWIGYACIAAYLLVDLFRTFPRTNRCGVRCP